MPTVDGAGGMEEDRLSPRGEEAGSGQMALSAPGAGSGTGGPRRGDGRRAAGEGGALLPLPLE